MGALEETISSVGIAAWGSSMPVMSPTWTDGTQPTADEAGMALTLGGGSWRAPLAGTVAVPAAGRALPLTLIGPGGGPLPTSGVVVLTFDRRAYLRLAHLYAQVLEDPAGARAERARGLPFRPVPLHVCYTADGGTGGNIAAGGDLGVRGSCTFHDASGLPIDPLAVAAAFTVLMTAHNTLQGRPLGAAFDASHQVSQIAALAGTADVRLRLADHAGRPHDGTQLQGITGVNAPVGLFTLDSGLAGTVSKAPTSGAFPAEARRLLRLGPAGTGTLGEQFTPPTAPAGVTLTRDFFSLCVTDLGGYLRGTPDPDWDGTKVHPQPEVRLDEALTLLVDGNDVLASAAAALAGTPVESHVVAQVIDGAFPVPAMRGTAAHWPGFPATTGTAASAGPIPVGLRTGFAMTAGFLSDGNPATADVDVVVTLSRLPEEAHVRLYPRVFLPDAREARGDGAAGIARSGSLTLLLRDPFRLRVVGLPDSAVVLPSQARLVVDVIVVKRTGEARIFGAVAVDVAAPSPRAVAPAPASNPFAAAPRRGISNAGVLGLRGPAIPAGTTDLLGVITALSGEGQPRDASRLPTMAHRELIVAGQTSGIWRAVLSGGRLESELHSASPRLGAPGGLGGRETQAVGVAADGGRLAWDLGRAAFRRTTRFDRRMGEIANARWDQPSVATSPLGTMAGVALQTTAPSCATPELAVLRASGAIDPDSTTRPQSFDDLVDWLEDNLLSAGVPFGTQIIDALKGLKDDDTLSESTRERLFEEAEREVMTSAYGRRDTQWALLDAIVRARRFIYIETPGFAPTQRDYAATGDPIPPYAADLIAALASRLNAAPGLHVAICVPRDPDFAPGYEPAAAYEATARRTAILRLPTASSPDTSRVVAFHPVGFPGRRSRLESTVVIVDDVWALVGACTLRRRGLTLDGSTDVALTDMELEEGVCPSLRTFRRTLVADRLGIPATSASTFGFMPDPRFVRLDDGIEMIGVIREQLLAGGLGRIERLWTGVTPGTTPITPLDQRLADPDGEEFDLPGILALATIAANSGF
ncbi:hypothetical protein [Streptomyces sp. NPDC057280]|uniref:hypothetical protein n=1 Tax=Streptomyces sp. NPDC057280 TaxID=3346081 RepID=UPI00363FCEF0